MPMPRRRYKALVLGDDVRSLLSVIRSLGRGGIETHIGWHPPDSEALWSRYVAQAHDLPPYNADDPSWKSVIIDLMNRHKFDLVVPCSDPSLLPLQKHRAELEPHGRISLLDDEVFRVVSDKFQANNLARSLGLRVPHEILVERPEQSRDIRGEMKLPVVLKPQSSFDRGSVGQRRVVRFVKTWDDLEPTLKEMLSEGPVAAQEYFRGRGCGVELMMSDGEPLLEFQHLRLYEPPWGGAGPYRESMALTPQLRDAALSLLRALRYTGVAMVEFKLNTETGDWAFIEVNGRFWGSLPLAIAAGADFPLALFEHLVEGRRDFPHHYRVGLRCRNWRLMRWWLTANLRARRQEPELPTISLGKVGVDALVSLVSLRERSDTFTLDDPLPAVAEIRSIAKEGWDSVASLARRKWFRSTLVRKRMQCKARTAIQNARSILFVCYGNICRSPFAEHIARQYLPSDRIIRSAGYHPKAQRPCPELAVATANSWGIDLGEHRSQVITDALLHSADVVFVFDQRNYVHMSKNHPDIGSLIHYVGALDYRIPIFIEDPYGQDPSLFERSYRQIANALKACISPADI